MLNDEVTIMYVGWWSIDMYVGWRSIVDMYVNNVFTCKRHYHACCITLFIYIIYLQYVCWRRRCYQLYLLREDDDDARDLDTGVAAVTEVALLRARLDLSAPVILLAFIYISIVKGVMMMMMISYCTADYSKNLTILSNQFDKKSVFKEMTKNLNGYNEYVLYCTVLYLS